MLEWLTKILFRLFIFQDSMLLTDVARSVRLVSHIDWQKKMRWNGSNRNTMVSFSTAKQSKRKWNLLLLKNQKNKNKQKSFFSSPHLGVGASDDICVQHGVSSPPCLVGINRISSFAWKVQKCWNKWKLYALIEIGVFLLTRVMDRRSAKSWQWLEKRKSKHFVQREIFLLTGRKWTFPPEKATLHRFVK